MYAVIRTGGKQYRVSADDVIEVEKIDGEAGAAVSFDEVMMIGGEGQDAFGKPLVDGARVAAEVVEQKRGPKIIVFKKIRRQNYRRRNGHRQSLTKVRILEILAKGQNPTKKAGERPAVAAAKAAGGQKFELLKAPQGKQDNISLLSGVGPALEKKLHDYGIFHFWQIAAMADADIAKMDEALSLAGRATREEWVEQAKELMAGKAPRAKIDQKAASVDGDKE